MTSDLNGLTACSPFESATLLTVEMSGPAYTLQAFSSFQIGGLVSHSALVVGSASSLREFAQSVLVEHSFAVTIMAELNELHLAIERVDIVLLCGDGAETHRECQKLRASSAKPIVCLGTDEHEDTVIAAYESGATDVIITPIAPRILVAKLRNHIKAAAHPVHSTNTENVLMVDGMLLDLESRTAWLNGRELPLTRIEFDLLSLLMSKPEKVFSRAEIINDVWHDQWFGDDHVLETHVSRLRKKIRNLDGPELLTSLRGVGYRFHPSVSPKLSVSQGQLQQTR